MGDIKRLEETFDNQKNQMVTLGKKSLYKLGDFKLENGIYK